MKKTLLKTTALVAFFASASAAACDHFTLQATGNITQDSRESRNFGMEGNLTWDLMDGVEFGFRGVHKFNDAMAWKKQLHSMQVLGQVDLVNWDVVTVFADVSGGISWMFRDVWKASGFTSDNNLNGDKLVWMLPWSKGAQFGFSAAGHIGARIEITDGISFVAKIGGEYEAERQLHQDVNSADHLATLNKDAAAKAEAAAKAAADSGASDAATVKAQAAQAAKAAKAELQKAITTASVDPKHKLNVKASEVQNQVLNNLVWSVGFRYDF